MGSSKVGGGASSTWKFPVLPPAEKSPQETYVKEPGKHPAPQTTPVATHMHGGPHTRGHPLGKWVLTRPRWDPDAEAAI